MYRTLSMKYLPRITGISVAGFLIGDSVVFAKQTMPSRNCSVVNNDKYTESSYSTFMKPIRKVKDYFWIKYIHNKLIDSIYNGGVSRSNYNEFINDFKFNEKTTDYIIEKIIKGVRNDTDPVAFEYCCDFLKTYSPKDKIVEKIHTMIVKDVNASRNDYSKFLEKYPYYPYSVSLLYNLKNPKWISEEFWFQYTHSYKVRDKNDIDEIDREPTLKTLLENYTDQKGINVKFPIELLKEFLTKNIKGSVFASDYSKEFINYVIGWSLNEITSYDLKHHQNLLDQIPSEAWENADPKMFNPDNVSEYPLRQQILLENELYLKNNLKHHPGYLLKFLNDFPDYLGLSVNSNDHLFKLVDYLLKNEYGKQVILKNFEKLYYLIKCRTVVFYVRNKIEPESVVKKFMKNKDFVELAKSYNEYIFDTDETDWGTKIHLESIPNYIVNNKTSSW